MGNRAGQVDMAHALTAHLRQGDFDPALLAHDASVLQALVLATQALVVVDGTEDLGAEKPVALRLEGPVIDGLRLLDLAVGPRADHVRRRQTDLDGVELQGLALLLENLEKVFQFHSSGMEGRGPRAKGQGRGNAERVRSLVLFLDPRTSNLDPS